jgi:von Willebrand factor type A domain
MKSSLRSKGTLFGAALGLFAFVALPAACGSDSGNGSAGPGVGGSANGTGTGGSANGTGTGGSSASGGGGTGGGLNLDSSVGGGTADAATCGEAVQKADLVPLDLYVMLDQSGSMDTGGYWDEVVNALQGFVTDSASADLGVALQFFPGFPECMVGTYAAPSVPMGLLPANAPNIAGALSAAVPGGQTPTLPALQGAQQYMTNWLLQNPTHTGVVVLATDGVPNDCASTIDKVAQAATDAANENPKILTFVIGVGTQLTALDQVAQAGGTNKAFIVDPTANVTQQFIDALNAIRGGAVACEFLIPTPEGGKLDPGKVNVKYKPGNGDPEVTIPKVQDQASCPANGDAWYYDNPSSPTKVILCPSTCDKVKQDSGAEVGVQFGCKSIVA